MGDHYKCPLGVQDHPISSVLIHGDKTHHIHQTHIHKAYHRPTRLIVLTKLIRPTRPPGLPNPSDHQIQVPNGQNIDSE